MRLKKLLYDNDGNVCVGVDLQWRKENTTKLFFMMKNIVLRWLILQVTLVVVLICFRI